MTVLRLRLSSFDQQSFTLNLEPEGAEHRLPPGTAVTVELPSGTRDVEVSWHSSGLSLMRDGSVSAYPTVRAQDGRILDW